MTDPQERGDLAPGEREMTSADLTAHDPEHGHQRHADETEAPEDAESADDADSADSTELAASTGVPDETELPDERAGEGA